MEVIKLNPKDSGAKIIIYPKHLKIIGAIKEYQVQHGYSPTTREIAKIVGISPSQTSVYIKEMELLGSIKYGKTELGNGKCRTIVVTV